MTRRFSVAARGDALPLLTSRRVVFDGINKSGSLAMTNVLREAYHFDGRANQFFSHYHSCPKSLPELIRIIKNSRSGHGFFVGHYLYRAFDPDLPGCAIVTQFRHPLSRVLSCYSWLKRKHAESTVTAASFPTLEQWVKRTKGRAHSQAIQFGVGFGEWAEASEPDKDLRALLDRALGNIEKHVAWYGIAEYFE